MKRMGYERPPRAKAATCGKHKQARREEKQTQKRTDRLGLSKRRIVERKRGLWSQTWIEDSGRAIEESGRTGILQY